MQCSDANKTFFKTKTMFLFSRRVETCLGLDCRAPNRVASYAPESNTFILRTIDGHYAARIWLQKKVGRLWLTATVVLVRDSKSYVRRLIANNWYSAAPLTKLSREAETASSFTPSLLEGRYRLTPAQWTPLRQPPWQNPSVVIWTRPRLFTHRQMCQRINVTHWLWLLSSKNATTYAMHAILDVSRW